LLLCGSLAASISGCGGNDGSGDAGSNGDTAQGGDAGSTADRFLPAQDAIADHVTSPHDARSDTPADAPSADATAGDAASDDAMPTPPTSMTYGSAAAACAAEPFPTAGTIRYACDCQTGADTKCVAGDDTNDGTSPATAWRSYGKVVAQYGLLPAGGTLALCRGGAFSAAGLNSTTVANNNCRSTTPCLLRDYAPTNWTAAVDHLPIIHSGTGIALTINENAAYHQEGFRILNLDLEGDGVGQSGIFLDNDVSDVFVCGVTFNGMSQTGSYFGGAGMFPSGCYSPGPPVVDTCPWQRRITYQGNLFSNIALMGFFGYGESININYNRWQHTGSDNEFDHVLYFGAGEIDHTVPMTQVILRDEHFIGNEVVDPGSGGVCDGTIIVAHGAHAGMVIQDNVFSFTTNTRTGNCFGIGIGSGTVNYPDLFLDAFIDSNVINGFSNQAITVNSCQNCTVSNNLMINDDAMFNSICVASGVALPEKYDLGSTDARIVNNTCYLAGSRSNNIGVVVKGQGTGYVLANNVTFFDSSSSGFDYFCYDHTLGTGALVGGTASSDAAAYAGITNGGFDVTIDGTLHHVAGLDFSSATNIADIPVTLNAALSALGAQATWMGGGIIVNTTAASGTTTISVASAPTGGNATDVSGTLGLSAAAGAVVRPTYAFDDNSLCYAPTGPTLAWDYTTRASLSAWRSASGFDTSSLLSAPQFVHSATTGYDFHPASGSPLNRAGNSTYAPALDITGMTRSNPPNIGAY
jgi:hypothetical protein